MSRASTWFPCRSAWLIGLLAATTPLSAYTDGGVSNSPDGGWGFAPEWPGADQLRRELLDLGHRMMLG